MRVYHVSLPFVCFLSPLHDGFSYRKLLRKVTYTREVAGYHLGIKDGSYLKETFYSTIEIPV